jgi:CHAD domain-containing protein
MGSRRQRKPRAPRHKAGARAKPRRLKDALIEQVSSAHSQLGQPHPSDPEVHAARKFIKKARAMVRLMRDAIGEEIYRRENQALRDAARPLSASRDSKVLLEAIETLAKKHRVDPATTETVRTALEREQTRIQRRASVRKDLTTSRQRLGAVLRRVSRWPQQSGDNTQLVRSVKRVYRRARRAFEAACEEKNAENLHEWRKNVKYLWHQMQFLEASGRGAIGKCGNELHKLSGDLGDDHDLAVLSEWVRRKRGLLAPKASKGFFAAVDRRQSRLQKSAFSRGRGMFSDRPSEFADWLQKAIKTSRAAS